jgi:hypothetical protein
MNKKIKKKASRDIFIVGIASASVFLSGSALALEKTNTRDSDQFLNNHTSLPDSTVKSTEVLAQTGPEGNTPSAPSGVNSRDNSPPGNSQREDAPPSGKPVSPPPPPDAKPRGSSPPPTGTSPVDNPPRDASGPGPKPGTWLCINNPNPSCRG